jgi:hypothetical protein
MARTWPSAAGVEPGSEGKGDAGDTLGKQGLMGWEDVRN